jgi:hypothetical protein
MARGGHGIPKVSLRPVGEPPLKQPYSRFWGGLLRPSSTLLDTPRRTSISLIQYCLKMKPLGAVCTGCDASPNFDPISNVASHDFLGAEPRSNEFVPQATKETPCQIKSSAGSHGRMERGVQICRRRSHAACPAGGPPLKRP